MKSFFTMCLIVLTGTLYAQPCGSPPTINFNFNSQAICPGEYATFTAAIIGSVGTIHYNWFPEPSNTNTISVSPTITSWQYLEITDDCFTVLDSVHINVNPVVITSINVTNATNCPGEPGTLGSIQVLPDNPTFTYTLSGGGNILGPQLAATFFNLPGGVGYFLHIENTTDCVLDTAVMVGLGSNNVTATFDPSDILETTCSYTNDGAAEISDIGGGLAEPYTVFWTNTSGVHSTESSLSAGAGSSQTDLVSGNWVVTVTDQNGCAWSEIFTVGGPAEMVLDFNTNNPTCYQFTDGSVVVTATGGNGGNSFVITNGAGTQVNLGGIPGTNNLAEGWYFATVTDTEGCVGEDSVYLDTPGEIAVDLTITDLICSYDGNGSIVVDDVHNFQGDFDNISYFWNPNPNGTNGIGATENNGLNGGDYTLTVNDEYGCSNTFDVHVSPGTLYFIDLGSDPWSSSLDGVVYCSVDGGTAPYTYTWDDLGSAATYSGNIWGGRDPGDYEITVTDANGCILTDTVTVGYLAIDEKTNTTVKVYPTLVQQHSLYVESNLESESVLQLYSLSGELVLTTSLINGKQQIKLNLAPGSYFYTILVDGTELQNLRGKLIIAD